MTTKKDNSNIIPKNMEFTDTETAEAEKFCKFYIDLVDNNCQNNLKYYLAENVVLDWFGHTIKSDKKVVNYLKTNSATVKHFFQDAKPVNKIGFRDTHAIKNPREAKKLKLLMSPPPVNNEGFKTPPKETQQPSTSCSLTEKGGHGDGFHNNHHDTAPESPSTAKRFKSSDGNDHSESIETIEEENDCQLQVKYVTVDGDIEFHKPSTKKFQTETKWRRPCKLSIAYTGASIEDCTIHLIIYEGNLKCRRNLLKDFEAQELDS